MSQNATERIHATMQVTDLIQNERARQRQQWGNDHDDRWSAWQWLALVAKWTGKIGDHCLFGVGIPPKPRDMNLKGKLVKTAAILVAWIEAIDRRWS